MAVTSQSVRSFTEPRKNINSQVLCEQNLQLHDALIPMVKTRQARESTKVISSKITPKTTANQDRARPLRAKNNDSNEFGGHSVAVRCFSVPVIKVRVARDRRKCIQENLFVIDFSNKIEIHHSHEVSRTRHVFRYT